MQNEYEIRDSRPRISQKRRKYDENSSISDIWSLPLQTEDRQFN